MDASTRQVGTRVYTCIGGGAVDADGVCVEHGETACVIGFTLRVAVEPRTDDEPILVGGDPNGRTDH